MAAVVFAFGNRPGISEHEALELAEILSHRRNLAAVSAAGRIEREARKDPDAGEISRDVELTRDELEELAAVLAEERVEGDSPALARLRREVIAELSRSGGNA